jgi:hypothetical protein
MNEQFFHPRKLHVKIINTKKLKKRLGFDKKSTLLEPLGERNVDLSVQERCLKYQSEKSCELSFEVPGPAAQTTVLARIANWEVRHKIAKANKQAKWSRKRALKRHAKGKKLKDGWAEKSRVKQLDWIFIQNLDEWQTIKAEKEAKKEEKRRTSTWRTIR